MSNQPNPISDRSARHAARRDLVIAALYIVSIFATLSVVRAPLQMLRDAGALSITLATILGGCAIVAITLLHGRNRLDATRLGALAGVAAIAALFAKRLSQPEELIHYVQYGLVGIFLIRALRHFLTRRWCLYAVALLAASLIGLFDELVQGWLPNRHYDTNDVILNAFSAGLGIVVFSLFQAPSDTDHYDVNR